MIGTLFIISLFLISLYFVNSFLKQVQEISVALGLHLRIGDEAERRAVDAVAHAVGGFRIAGEHMPEVGVSGAAGTSVRRMPKLLSSSSTTAGSSMGFVKAAQQQYRGEQKRQYSPIHGVSLLSER